MTQAGSATNDHPITVAVQSRWDDADRHGHVNNAAYLALIRAAHDLAAAQDQRLATAGELCELEISYRAPVEPDTVVRVTVQPLPSPEPVKRVAYSLAVDNRVVASATATWQPPGAPVSRTLAPIESRGRPFRFTHEVRSYEVGAGGRVSPPTVLQWLEYAVLRAAARAGWTREGMQAADFMTLVIGHHLVLPASVGEGDVVEVTSRLAQVRRVLGVWRHEIRRSDGPLVAADDARGAFLDLAGRIRAAPSRLIDDLLRGEPDS